MRGTISASVDGSPDCGVKLIDPEGNSRNFLLVILALIKLLSMSTVSKT